MNIETEHVQNVYDIISNHFSATRYNVWVDVKRFLDSIPKYSLVFDAGCGNGKNMYRNDCIFFGGDFCYNLLKISKKYTTELLQLNIKNLPYKDSVFDYCISIAVIHHIYNHIDRINTIKELVRVTKPGGKILISVWCKHGKYKHGNNMIRWCLQDKYNKSSSDKYYERFYYMYNENELKNDVEKYIDNVTIYSYSINFNNAYLVIYKND